MSPTWENPTSTTPPERKRAPMQATLVVTTSFVTVCLVACATPDGDNDDALARAQLALSAPLDGGHAAMGGGPASSVSGFGEGGFGAGGFSEGGFGEGGDCSTSSAIGSGGGESSVSSSSSTGGNNLLRCGESRPATQQDSLELTRTTEGHTEAYARELCESSNRWQSDAIDCVGGCSAMNDEGRQLDPPATFIGYCDEYFGPNVQTTQACTCTQSGNYWRCRAVGRTLVGESLTCQPCKLIHVWYRCGDSGALPYNANKLVSKRVTGTTEQETRDKCQTAEFTSFSFQCKTNLGGPRFNEYPTFAATTVRNIRVAECWKEGNVWNCQCEADLKDDTMIDCRFCAARR